MLEQKRDKASDSMVSRSATRRSSTTAPLYAGVSEPFCSTQASVTFDDRECARTKELVPLLRFRSRQARLESQCRCRERLVETCDYRLGSSLSKLLSTSTHNLASSLQRVHHAAAPHRSLQRSRQGVTELQRGEAVVGLQDAAQRAIGADKAPRLTENDSPSSSGHCGQRYVVRLKPRGCPSPLATRQIYSSWCSSDFSLPPLRLKRQGSGGSQRNRTRPCNERRQLSPVM